MSSDFDWTLARSFLAILRQGSLSAAARSLHVAQPTVRRHLDELEKVLGAPLFARAPSGLVPTPLAIELRPAAEAMEGAAGSLMRTATPSASEPRGAVRITASEVMAVEVLPPIIADLRRRHPGLHVEIVASDLIADILRLDADIAIRMVRPVQNDLVVRNIGTIPLGLFAHEKWLASNPVPTTPEDLIGSGVLIGNDRDDGILGALRSIGLSALRTDFHVRSDSGLVQLACLRAGAGVGVCQVPLASRSSGLQRIIPEFEYPLPVWLAVQPDVRATLRVDRAMAALTAGLAAYLT